MLCSPVKQVEGVVLGDPLVQEACGVQVEEPACLDEVHNVMLLACCVYNKLNDLLEEVLGELVNGRGVGGSHDGLVWSLVVLLFVGVDG